MQNLFPELFKLTFRLYPASPSQLLCLKPNYSLKVHTLADLNSICSKKIIRQIRYPAVLKSHSQPIHNILYIIAKISVAMPAIYSPSSYFQSHN